MNVHGYAISDNVVDIHISVGFCVARFDKQAMPEPLSVGRVTSADSHAFFMCVCQKRNRNFPDVGVCWGSDNL